MEENIEASLVRASRRMQEVLEKVAACWGLPPEILLHAALTEPHELSHLLLEQVAELEYDESNLNR